MTVNEVAGILGYSKEQTQNLISRGMSLPKSKEVIKLASSKIGKVVDVSDDQFNSFIARFEEEEPGRHPPAEVRRQLLVESHHVCAICERPAPPQFHHMLEWSKVKHHDPVHMLHLCGTCHDRCGSGQIDYKSQLDYKTRLLQHTSKNRFEDPHLTRKRNADKRILEKLFEYAPRPIIVRFLKFASQEQIHIDYLICAELLQWEIESPSFHLYDNKLWDLLKTFMNEWKLALAISSTTYHDYQGEQHIATPIVSTLGSGRNLYERREEFLQQIFMTQHAYGLLNCHVREEYPDLDLDEIDRHGMAAFAEMQAESEKQFKSMLRRANRKAKK